ncbi:Uncharacterised protein [Chlamydia trachomatis]|nr:Uncharacterised protein [Chlamydia trachomatis]
MRDNQQSTIRAGLREARVQVTGQPRDAFNIEVVRRLVQADDVRFGGEYSGKCNATPLPTRQCSDQCVRVDVGQQASVDVADRRVRGPLVFFKPGVDSLDNTHLGVERIHLIQHNDADTVALGDEA